MKKYFKSISASCLHQFIVFGYFILSTVLFSLQISKYYWFVFVWRGAICLIFTIQYILRLFFLSEFSFESFIIFFFCCCVNLPLYCHISEWKSWKSNIIVQRVQRTKLDSESFVNVSEFIRYLPVVLKKTLLLRI